MATQPGIFHIHVDGTHVPPELRARTIELGYVDTNFDGHPYGYEHFEPVLHLTLKVSSRDEFDKKWAELVALYSAHAGFTGYLEGEYIKIDEELPEKAYAGGDDLCSPFRITRRRLTDAERFRQTELHLTMNRDRSDPRLITALLEAGLYGAHMPKNKLCCDGSVKEWHDLVLTAQGSARAIVPLVASVRAFVETVGGAVGCTLKEEVAHCHYLQGITPADLPEIVDRVELIG